MSSNKKASLITVQDATITFQPRGNARLFASFAHELARRGLAERGAAREQLDGLDGVRLAHGVVPHQHIHARRKRNLQLVEVAEIAQGNGCKVERHVATS